MEETGMTRSRVLMLIWALCLLFISTTARAQSAFAGVVKDTSGAVLPGVTVEASSPALIEGVRSVSTDANGAFKIENLRPGVYTLSFGLPGFSTVKREGVELASNFTATINAEMKVGAVEETITVSCVQRRLARSAGGSPARATARGPVAWVAGRRVIKDLKPIDNPIERMGASHRAAAVANADVASKFAAPKAQPVKPG